MWRILIGIGLLLAGCSKQPSPADASQKSILPKEIRPFVEHQQQRALTLAQKLGVQADSDTLKYFEHARKGEYRAASEIYQDLRERGGKVDSPKHDPDLCLTLWDPLLEAQLTLEAYEAGAGQYATIFGQTIVQSIPPGSIYFGGTDPGRGLVAAFCWSRGDPFFVLTQNQLTDGQHLDYLRASFGEKIKIPTSEGVQKVFIDYLADAGRRYKHDKDFPNEPRQLRTGEDVKIVDGRTNIIGQAPVIAVCGLLTKVLFEKNPDREFYVEESFPLDWMYPYLTPHGFIMKLNRHPLPELMPEIIARDQEFWKAWQTRFIGDWLTPQTSVKELCDFVEAVYLKKDYADFRGDTNFVGNSYVSATYGKLRGSQAGLYAWRLANSQSSEEQQRMTREADFACRQAIAFCPTSYEAIFNYVNLLLKSNRVGDALLIARTALKLKPSDDCLKNLVHEIEALKQ